MKRNTTHEAQVMFLIGQYCGSRIKPSEIEALDEEHSKKEPVHKPMENDEVWNAVHCLVDQGALAPASKTADYFRITYHGYNAFSEEIG